MSLQAFVDDSGSDVDSPFVVCAGFVSTGERWANFSSRWLAALERFPRIGYFRLNEAKALKKQFQGWTEEDRNRKVEALANVVRTCALHRVECSISRTDYNQIILPLIKAHGASGEFGHRMDRQGFQIMQDPFALCFYGLVTGYFLTLNARNLLQEVEFTFDVQGRIEKYFKKAWTAMQQCAPPAYQKYMNRGPEFCDDKECLPLQAADMIAGELRAFLCGFPGTGNVRRIVGKVPLAVQNRWSKGHLMEFAKALL